MKVGDLVHMPGSIEPTKGIVLREERIGVGLGFVDTDNPREHRVEVYWISEGESSREPVKWLKVINPS